MTGIVIQDPPGLGFGSVERNAQRDWLDDSNFPACRLVGPQSILCGRQSQLGSPKTVAQHSACMHERLGYGSHADIYTHV